MSDAPKIGEFYTHKKRGTRYRTSAVAEVQASEPIHEGDRLVIYEDGIGVYARPLKEFMDGRFEHDEKREAYLAGWRAGREAAAREVDCICTKECGSSEECRRDIAVEIRAIPEPCAEPSPSLGDNNADN